MQTYSSILRKRISILTLRTRYIQTHFGIVKLTHSLTLSCIYLSIWGKRVTQLTHTRVGQLCALRLDGFLQLQDVFIRMDEFRVPGVCGFIRK